MNLIRALASQPRTLLLLEACVLFSAFFLVDAITPLELSMFVFYAFPVFFVALLHGPKIGFAIAMFAAVGSWLTNLDKVQSLTIYTWTGLNRITSFLFVAGCAVAIRREREGFRQRLETLERSRELEQDIVKISEREQMRIGQDLHDGLCQTLAAIDCVAADVRKDLEAKSLPEAISIGELQSLLRNACIEARSLARGIFPVQMDVGGLAPALQELVGMMQRTFHVSVGFTVNGEIHIEDIGVAMHLYRIAQEALSNALRHSGAKHVHVGLAQNADRLALSITDDGRGFIGGNAEGHSLGMGLRTIRYRAGLIGADVVISPGSMGGVEVRCTVPAARTRKAPDLHLVA